MSCEIFVRQNYCSGGILSSSSKLLDNRKPTLDEASLRFISIKMIVHLLSVTIDTSPGDLESDSQESDLEEEESNYEYEDNDNAAPEGSDEEALDEDQEDEQEETGQQNSGMENNLYSFFGL